LSGAQSVQLRWEVFNVLNHVNFNAPVTSLNIGTFGTIQTAGDAYHAVRPHVHLLMRNVLIVELDQDLVALLEDLHGLSRKRSRADRA
jgi:hypothetical protein